MRSYLIVRASSEEDLSAASSSGADALVLDLGGEGSGSDRERARNFARRFLIEMGSNTSRPALHVLLACLESPDIDGDLAALLSAGPDGVFLPRACGGASIQRLSAKLAVYEAESGREDGSTRIFAMATQTPAAIFASGSYAGASRRLAGLAFDVEPLRSALGAEATLSAAGEFTGPFAAARALTLFGASAAGTSAIDGPCRKDADEAALREQCRAARRDGFSAKLASSASHIPVINETFARDPVTL